MEERKFVKDYYENVNDFLEDVKKVNTRKLTSLSDKDLIKKLKRWIKEYWGEDGSTYMLFESQYKRLKMILKDQEFPSK